MRYSVDDKPYAASGAARLIVCFLVLLSLFVGPRLSAIDPAGVVILANSNDRESVALAEFYAGKRGVPAGRIIALPLPADEIIDAREFVVRIWDPLREALVEQGMVQGVFLSGRDRFTRNRLVVSRHDISAIVICKGVPLGFRAEPLWVDEQDKSRLPEQFVRTEKAIDSALSLILESNHSMVGPAINPHFRERPGPESVKNRVVPVGRLDGPSFSLARDLVNKAIEAEKKGLRGRAYVDIGGPHPTGDEWLRQTEAILRRHDFATDTETTRALFQANHRFDAPALYFGWYSRNIEGVWNDIAVMPPPGAIGFHIHSFSASTLRHRARGWSAPLVANGMTLTVGNVFEPYLEATHLPHLFLIGLLEGKTAGMASLESLRFINWQTILLGDPLYRPFAADAKPATAEAGFDFFSQYGVIREMLRLEREGEISRAGSMGQARFYETPGLALALETGRLLQKAGREQEAAQIVDVVGGLTTVVASEAIVAVELAELAGQLGKVPGALALLQRLANDSSYPNVLRLEIARRGAAFARSHNRTLEVGQFNQIEARLQPPPGATQ